MTQFVFTEKLLRYQYITHYKKCHIKFKLAAFASVVSVGLTMPGISSDPTWLNGIIGAVGASLAGAQIIKSSLDLGKKYKEMPGREVAYIFEAEERFGRE